MAKFILHEVGPRDGLQMEKQTVPIDEKLRWIRGSIKAGVDIVQVGSFVHPGKVPQMADTDRLFSELVSEESRNSILSGLVLNDRGLDRGLACGVEMFCMGVSASETHSKKNTGKGTLEATDQIIGMAKRALTEKKKVQVSVQSAFGCGFEGAIPHDQVLAIVRKYLDAGLMMISLADTAGHASPDDVSRLFEAIFKMDSKVEAACHFHNTYGMGLANCYAAMKVGVTNFESSVGGLGGCPFTAIAGGNVCTEDLVHMWHRMKIRPDIDLGQTIDVAKDVANFFKRDLPGTIYKTGAIA